MASAGLLVLFALISLTLANEIEDVEQKKRATNKGTSLNAIPSGAQKQEYTYLYQQPAAQAGTPNQPSSSFYPNLPSNQYYSQGEQPVYQQPQLNYVHQNAQQFVPLNFIPNPGYQAKYQILPKGAGGLQVAVLPQSAYLSPPPVYQQQQALYSNHQVPQQVQYQTLPSQQYQIPQAYVNHPSFPVSQPYVGHPSMALYAQPQAPLYNNYLYSNAAQQLYNYFQSNPQAKYQLLYGNQGQQGAAGGTHQPAEYDKPLPGPISQSISKEDNDLINNDYITPAESNSSYKNAYTESRASSYKP